MSLVDKLYGFKDAVGFDTNGVGFAGILNAEAMLQYGNVWSPFASYCVGSFIMLLAVDNFLKAFNSYSHAKKDLF